MASDLNEMIPDNCEEELQACPHCNRTFNPSVLTKHADICARVLKKREVFDSSLQRREKFRYYNTSLRSTREPQPSTSHSTYTVTNRNSAVPPADSASQQDLAAAVPSRSDTSNKTKRKSEPSSSASLESSTSRRLDSLPLERCPYCERKFNQKVIDSHLAFCKEKSVKAAFTVAYGTSKDDKLSAKKRMEARMKYKPPKPKSKHSTH
ncbi:PREDICTED: zinc finger C2HC domain-containing protein 1A-like [Drosophila arizonae]|uniref:Zinc finger C2HC domain-containing protein 1A-like n=1 Tax=Drosophila arizonae TaxID=7263 RepID=A0ABM1PZL9_DROAR|nr:PREDICTED: zinc finger C2HC domain-containing protein 1A-like [Drosophila arizonae]